MAMEEGGAGRSRPSDLLQTVIRLSRRLHRDGAGTSLGQTLVAARGLRLIDIGRRADLKSLLRASLVSTPEALDLFEYHFHDLFSPLFDRTPPAGGEPPPPNPFTSPNAPTDAAPEEDTESELTALPFHVAGSLSHSYARRDFAGLGPGEAGTVLREARKLARIMAGRLKKRLALLGRAERIDFRRTFRASLQTGGEPIRLKRRPPRPRPRRIVLFCDVSGSMDVYTRFFLAFAHGLVEAGLKVDAFVFSTRLAAITPVLKRTRAEDLMDRLSVMGLPLSGGTDIGGALTEFRSRYGSALAGKNTLFIILSDGWDRGAPSLLAHALGRLRLSTAGILWLNPLAADPGYEPLATGMATALPYLDLLTPFSRLIDIADLGRRLARMVI